MKKGKQNDKKVSFKIFSKYPMCENPRKKDTCTYNKHKIDYFIFYQFFWWCH